jgi:geranylgeranyl pyrophosphate synthase
LPQYGDYTQLAERSWGHTLTASGVLMAAGSAPASQELVQLQRFFRHFLIARQLNDDAHDWEDDLRCGHITAVVALLLGSESHKGIRLKLANHIGSLRERFWEETIVQVTQLIQEHIGTAREALAACPAIQHPEQLLSWIDKLERSAQAVIDGRTEAKRFIATMTTD